jgi:pentatricopeptide repeat domain-containing protein 1
MLWYDVLGKLSLQVSKGSLRNQSKAPFLENLFTAQMCCHLFAWVSQVYQKLLDANLSPIGTTYTALISAYGKAGKLECALETFQEMVRQGCERSVITYSALISACEKAGRWELALQLFDQMQQEGCTPNTVTYNALIMACSQGNVPAMVY